ncbi:phage tail tape measure protein [Staphylococcus nepalensis]|uniref:phage tail tape measure protein n=1 Tax=Staphylococcus nepalensis TaxID=214473 RepID=UPI000BC2E761|nr:phage tail tape measure protein [Staphylococcus nepalensis]ATH65429.1 phage tail tape measure protein [Staphylococcus nepalensis]
MENIEGYAIKNTMDNTGVEEGMKGLKRQMGVLSSEVKANMSSFGKAEKSVQKYQTRIEGLNNKMKVQKKMYDQAKTNLNNVKSSYEKATNSIKQQEQKVKELAEAHKKQDEAMRKSNQEMKKSNKELDNAKMKQSVLSAEKAKAKTKLDDLRSAERRLKESGKASTEQIKQASNATKQQREVHQKLIASHKEETANVKKLTQSNKSITEENKKVKASYQQSNDAVKTAEKEYDKLSKTIKDYPKDLAKAEKAVNNEKASMNGLQKSIDKAEQELKQMNKQQMIANSSYTKQADHLDKMSEKYGKMSQNMRSVGRNMSMYVTTPIAGAMGYAGKLGVEFDDGMRKVQAISGATGKDLDALKAKAREMGATTKFSASDSAEAMNYMAMAGWKSQDMMSGLPGIMDLAAASGEELGTVSDIVTDGLTAFGLEAKDSGRFADVLASASANANTNVQMMGEGFKYAAPVAGALGYSIEDTSTAIGLMSNAGIKGQKAGTALRTMFTNLSKPTAGMKDKMDELGISITDSKGEMLPMRDVMDQLRDKMGGLSKDQQAATASTIFGKEAMSGALAVINASQEDYDKLSKSIDNSEGSAKKMGDTMEKGLGGSLRELKSAAEELGLSVFETIQPALSGMVGGLKSTVDFLNDLPKGAKVAGVAIAGVAAAIGPVTLGVGLLLRAVQAAAGGYAQLNRRMAENSAEAAINAGATKANAGAITASGKSAKGSAGLFGRFGKSTGKAAGKVSLLGQASKVLGNGIKILGGPIGWIITGVTLLGGAFIKAYNNVDWFKKGVDGLFDVIKTFGGGAIDQLKNLGGWFSKTGSKIKETFFDEMKQGYKDLDDDDLLKKAGDGFKKFMDKVGTASDKATDTTKVLGKGVSKETKNALDKYVKYSEDTTRVLSDIKLNHGKITDDMREKLETSVRKGGEEALKQIQKRNKKVSDELNDMLENSEAFTAQEKQDMIQKNQEASDEKIKRLEELNQEIEELELKQFNDGKLTAQEEKDLKAKLDERNRITTESIAKGQKEQQAILSRMNANTGAIDTQQASEAIKDAVKAEKKAKKEAKKQREDDVVQADDLLAYGEIDQKEHDKRVREIEDAYDEAIDTAEGKTGDIRKSVKKNNKDIADDIDLSSGHVYSNSEKWYKKTKNFIKDDWNSFWQDVGSQASGIGTWIGDQTDEIIGAFKKGWGKVEDFFTETDWKELVNGWFENIGEWIASPFKAIGEDIGDAVSSWKENISEAGEDIKSGFDTITGWFSEQGQEFWDALKEGWNIAIEAGGDLWNSLTGWLGETYENVSGWFVEKGSNIWSSLKNGWNTAIETGGDLWQSLTGWLSEKWESTKEWFSEKGGHIWSNIKTGWNNALETGGNLWSYLTGWLGEKWEDTKEWFSQKGHHIWSNIKTGWNDALEIGGNLWSSLTSWLGEKWEETKTWFSQKGGHIWSNIKSGWNNALETGGNLWSSITNKLGESWENTKGWFSEKGQNIQQSFKNGWNSAWDTAGNIWGKVTKGVSDTWENVKTSTRDKLEEAKGTATDKTKGIWKNTSKWFGDTYNSAKDKVTGVYTKTRDKFTDAAGKVWDKSKSAYDGTKKWFGETYEKAKTKVTGVYNQAKGKFTDTASTAWDKSKSTWKGTSKYFGQAYSSVKTNVSNMWGKAKTSFGNIAGEGWKKAESVYKGFKKWLGDTLQWIKDIGADMGKAAGDLGKTVANKAVDGLNGMIGGVNKISKAITGKNELIKKIPHLATGTYDGSTLSTDSNGGLRQPTVAMVNDKGPGNGPGGRTQELIQRKDGSIDAPQGKNTIVGLGKGDGVINARHTHKLQEQGIIPKRLSTGTGTKIPRFSKSSKKKKTYEQIADSIKDVSGGFKDKASKTAHGIKDKTADAMETVGDKMKDSASWLGEKIGDVWKYVKHPGKLVNKVMDSIGINFGGGDNATVNLVKAAYKNLKSSLVDKVKDWFTEAKGGNGDASWLPWDNILQTFGHYTGGLMFNGGRHYGIDFGMPIGTPVKAVADGKVSKVWNDYGGGKSIEVQVGKNLWNWYMHLSEQMAKQGQKVSAGDVIGKSGDTGNFVNGAHLHFQLNKGDHSGNDTAINPKQWLESLESKGGKNSGPKAVQAWKPEVMKALGLAGLPQTSTYANAWLRQINTESTGNPKAVGPGSSEGNPKGLVQVKPGTFNAFKLSGHGNIFNGLDNLIAGMRYAKETYGGRMLKQIGVGGPYANGGIVTKHQIAEVGEKNRAEAIIPLHKSKRNRAVGLMEKAMTAIGMDNGSANVTVNNDNSTIEKMLSQLVRVNDQNNKLTQTIIKLLSNQKQGSPKDAANILSQILGEDMRMASFNQGG